MTRPNYEPKYVTFPAWAWSWDFGLHQYPKTLTTHWREWNGTTTPSYYLITRGIIPGFLPINSYTLKQRTVVDKGYYSKDYNSQGTLVSEAYYPVSDLVNPDFTYVIPEDLSNGAYDRALMRFRQKLTRNGAELAVVFAERRQTARTILDGLTRITAAAVALRSANWRAFTTALSMSETATRTVRRRFREVQRTPIRERLANHWLEYSYGWVPLLHDIYDSAELLADLHLGRKLSSQRVSAECTVEAPVQYDNFQGWDYNSSLYYKIRGKQKLRARFVGWVSVADEELTLLARTGLNNPASVAWELVPYSFIVDWVIPFGDYVKALNELDGLDVTNISLSTSYTTDINVSVFAHNGPFSPGHVDAYGEKTEKHFVYQRVGLATVPLPYLRTKKVLPTTWLSRVTSSLALLTQLFKR